MKYGISSDSRTCRTSELAGVHAKSEFRTAIVSLLSFRATQILTGFWPQSGRRGSEPDGKEEMGIDDLTGPAFHQLEFTFLRSIQASNLSEDREEREKERDRAHSSPDNPVAGKVFPTHTRVTHSLAGNGGLREVRAGPLSYPYRKCPHRRLGRGAGGQSWIRRGVRGQ